jgi:hypothetical protein
MWALQGAHMTPTDGVIALDKLYPPIVYYMMKDKHPIAPREENEQYSVSY